MAQVGEAAMSAVSLVDTVNVLLVNAFAALATAVPSLPDSIWVGGSRTRQGTPDSAAAVHG